nr:unnamed protein product [Digitaria exilis]
MDRLADGLAGASISDPADQGAATAAGAPSADYLVSVTRAVEGADATIRSQLEENNRLKEELMRKTQQLQRIREDATSQGPSSGVGLERNSVANKTDGSRHRKDGEYDSRLLPVSGMNSNLSWKQVKEGEEEIALLKKHLADYSVKAFDQQQQDLVDAASKALSYRQDIIEENIRLSYALQAAQQERSTFISSLLPLLSEYDNLQPPVLDAQSIVSNLKEQLIATESQNSPFKDLSRNDVLMDGSESTEAQNTQEPSTRWGPGDSPNLASGFEDANPSYPYLPTVLEEPGSSFSEAADDDPLPGIEGLRITGDAFPGRELLASGYPTNGTTTCNFEWVRHLEDGSVNFIEGCGIPLF